MSERLRGSGTERMPLPNTLLARTPVTKDELKWLVRLIQALSLPQRSLCQVLTNSWFSPPTEHQMNLQGTGPSTLVITVVATWFSVCTRPNCSTLHSKVSMKSSNFGPTRRMIITSYSWIQPDHLLSNRTPCLPNINNQKF